MNGQLGGQPIFILPEGSMRTTGKDAQMKNIAAAKTVAETIRTTLGPKGMDKMLVDSIGDITITNDGATILDEMEIEHPAAKMIVEVAKTQEDEVGDGTTTAAIIAGTLLKNSEDLLEQNIHPTIITRGYRLAKEKTMEILDQLAEQVTLEESKKLQEIAITAMTGKGSESSKEDLAKIAVDAVSRVAGKTEEGVVVDRDSIKIEKKQGGAIQDTELISGIVIDKEMAHSNMAKNIKDAKIALLDVPLEVKETETNAEIRITSPEQLKGFLDQESEMLKDMVRKLSASGCNVIMCQKGIDDLAQHYLAKKGISAVRRIKKSDMEHLTKATGAKIVSNTDELTEEDLGYAGIVEEKKVGDEKMVFVRDCKDPKAVSILIRGGTEHVVDEIERAMEDAVLGAAISVESGKIVCGGGAVEMEIAKELRNYADTVGGREQLAINAFADAIEIVPRTLAESTGLDPIDILVDLRSRHEKGEKTYGIDVVKGVNSDMRENNVIEPYKIKSQAVSSATEATEMILRIDDVVSSKGSGGDDMPAGPGAGGMPPGM